MINKEIEINGKTLKISTGQVAKQSAGSVMVSYGETTLIVAVNAAKEMREDINFFPLQVEYRERHYAGGKIPGGFFKREARPSEREILTSRLTDRPIRPLFPKSFKYETQVIITVLTTDGENPADVLTKYVSRQLMQEAISKLGLRPMAGRPACAPAAMGA